MISKDKKIIFIDLDSTLIKTISGKSFATCISDMTPIWKTWNSLKDWAKSVSEGYIFIVSNQGGIEKGTGSKEKYLKVKLEFVTKALQEYVDMNELMIHVDYIYCPHLSKTNPDRKPNTGMLETMLRKWFASKNYVPEKKEMVMIGDASGKEINPKSFSDSDLKTAENFGIDYIDVKSV